MERVSFSGGQVIFEAGDPGGCMYVVVSGKVGIYFDYGEPCERLISILLAEDSFGEISLLDGGLRSSTAVAEEDTILEVITQETLAEYFRKKPARVLVFTEKMTGNLRSLTKRYMEVCRLLADAEAADEAGRPRSEETVRELRKYADEYRRIASEG